MCGLGFQDQFKYIYMAIRPQLSKATTIGLPFFTCWVAINNSQLAYALRLGLITVGSVFQHQNTDLQLCYDFY